MNKESVYVKGIIKSYFEDVVIGLNLKLARNVTV